ncbi:hypothetical protein [Salinibacter ruber]|uniref:hypothetical protein n=1 Tax=Salinibacter ruber TaxID=146919 RepID=UPI00216A75AF|nr:hypothetical protein [Salinibacter ruber]MCS3698393.1 hypothetical protein [Salinibacter ruber]
MDNEKGLESIEEVKYDERQLITFVESSELENKIIKKGKIKGTSKAFILGFFGGMLNVPEKELSKATKNYIKEDTFVPAVPFSWARSLKLAPGHPRKDTLYVAHPSNKRRFLPVSEFHRLTFEDKFAEALRLLMYLGATEIDVEHRKGWERDFAGELSVNIPDVQGEASIESEVSSSGKALYHAELDGHSEPSIPDNLVWYPHELTWQVVAEGRMDFGLKDFSLTLKYTDDYGIDADLAQDAKTAGFSLGGSFKSYESTVWIIEGSFEL